MFLQHQAGVLGRRPCRAAALRRDLKPVVAQLPVPRPRTGAQVGAVDPSPFYEPLLRSFVLGVGAGVLCEVGHVLFKVAGVASELGNQDVVQALPHMMERFAPMFVYDHVAAMSSWMLLYAIEALAVLSVLKKYGDDTNAVERSLRALPTLPKRMLPLKLAPLKDALYRLFKGGVAIRALAAALPAPSALDQQPSAFAGPAVLERPPTAGPTMLPLPDIIAARPSSPATFPVPRSESPPRMVPGVSSRPGTLPPGTWQKGSMPSHEKRAKELRERSSYLRNFWYAAALSSSVGDEPVGVDLLGGRVVLFRDAQGEVHCLDDACPHRGAPLSEGWVAEVDGASAVVCPYHGWAFDCEGKLKDVPSVEKSGAWPKRSLLRSYPLEERGGFIWLFYGSSSMPAEERPPIPWTPELDNPSWTPVYGEIEFDCGHWGVFENAIDMAHIHYLHGDTFGNQDQPKIHGMHVERDTFDITANFQIHNKPVSQLWEFTSTPVVPVVAKAFLPSTSMVKIHLGAGVSMVTFVNTVPISATRSVNRFCLIRNFAGWAGFDKWALQAMHRILGEDKVMVEKLRPERLAFEVSLEPDAPQVAFRKLRQEWIDMGYGVPSSEDTTRRGLLDM